MDRKSLLQYESALALEQNIEALLSVSSWNGGKKNRAVMGTQDAEAQIVSYHTQVMELYKEALLARNDRRNGLERFEAGETCFCPPVYVANTP
jgi:hypothetical protein